MAKGKYQVISGLPVVTPLIQLSHNLKNNKKIHQLCVLYLDGDCPY